MSESDIATKTLSQRDSYTRMTELSDDPFADIAQDFEVNDQVFKQTQYVVIDPDQAHGLLANVYPSDSETLVRHTVALNALAEHAATIEETLKPVLPEWIVPKVKTRTYVPDLNVQNNRIRFVSRGIIPADAADGELVGSLTAGRDAPKEVYIFPKQKSVSESLLAPDMTKLDLRPEEWMKLAPDVCHNAIVAETGAMIRVPADEYRVVMDYTENGKILNEIRVEQERAAPEFVVTGFADTRRGLKRAKHHDRGVSSMDDILQWYSNNYSPENIIADNKKCAKTLRQLQTLMRMHGYDDHAITLDMIRKLPKTKQEKEVADWDAHTALINGFYRAPKMPKPSEIRSADNGRYYYQGILTDYIRDTKKIALPKTTNGMLNLLIEQVENDRKTNKGALSKSLDSITYLGVKRAGTYDRPMITEDNAGQIASTTKDDKVYQLLMKLDLQTSVGRSTFVQLIDMFRTIGKITVSNGQYVTTEGGTHICCSHELYDYRYGLSNKSDNELMELDFAVFRGGETLCKHCEKILSEFEDIGASFSAGGQIAQITGRSMLLGKDVTIGKEDTELYKFLMTVCHELRISPLAVSPAYDFIMKDRPIAAGVFGDVQYIELFQILNIGGELDEETTQRIWTRLQNYIKIRTVPAVAARMPSFVKSLQSYIDDIEDDTPAEVTKSYTSKLQAIYAMYMLKECCYRIAVVLKMAKDIVPEVKQDQIIEIYGKHCRQMKALCLAGLRDRNADVQTINKFAAIFGIELTAEKVKHLLPVFTQDKSLTDYIDYKITEISSFTQQPAVAVAPEEIMMEGNNCVPYMTDTMHGFYSGSSGGKYLVALRNQFQRANEFDRDNIGGPKGKTSVDDYLKKYEPVIDGEKTAYEDMINRKVQTEKDFYMTTIGYVAEFAGGETILSNPPKQMQNLPQAINTGYKTYSKNQDMFAGVLQSFDLAHPLPEPSAPEGMPDMLSLKRYMTNPTHRKDTQIPYEIVPPKNVTIIEKPQKQGEEKGENKLDVSNLEKFVMGAHPFSTNNDFKSITNIRPWIESQIDQQKILVSNLKLVVPNAVKEEHPMIKTTDRDFIRFSRIQSLGKQLVSIHQSLMLETEDSIIHGKISEIYSPEDYKDFKLRWYKPMANHMKIYTAAYKTEGVTTELVLKAVLTDIYAHAVKIRTGSEQALERGGFDVLTMHMGAFNLSDNISIHNRYLNFVKKIFEIIEDYMDILDINHTVMDDQEYKHYYRAVKITAPRKLDILERKDAEPVQTEEQEEEEEEDDIEEDEEDYDASPVDQEGDREEEEDAVGDYDNEFGNKDDEGGETELDDRD